MKVEPCLASALWLTVTLLLGPSLCNWACPGTPHPPFTLSHETSPGKPSLPPSRFLLLASRACRSHAPVPRLTRATLRHTPWPHAVATRVSRAPRAAVPRTAGGPFARRALRQHPLREYELRRAFRPHRRRERSEKRHRLLTLKSDSGSVVSYL